MKRRRRRRSLKLDAIRGRLDEATELVAMADETQRVREQRAKPRPPTDDKARSV